MDILVTPQATIFFFDTFLTFFAFIVIGQSSSERGSEVGEIGGGTGKGPRVEIGIPVVQWRFMLARCPQGYNRRPGNYFLPRQYA